MNTARMITRIVNASAQLIDRFILDLRQERMADFLTLSKTIHAELQ